MTKVIHQKAVAVLAMAARLSYNEVLDRFWGYVKAKRTPGIVTITNWLDLAQRGTIPPMGMGTKRGLEEPAELGRMLAVPQSQVYREVLEANSEYAKQFGDKCNLALPPARAFAILTCMDARLDPAKYAGLSEGDAHVIRNAGGRASDDAIRSLVISHKLLGTGEWFVIHHTNCGMELFSDSVMGDLLEDNLETASFDGQTWSNPKHGGGSSCGHFIRWLTIRDLERSVIEDVRRIREHPLVPKHIPVFGFIYDVKTGRLNEVAAATEAGRAVTS